jgi:hypothetical protein
VSDDFHPTAPVNRWHTGDEMNWEIRPCVLEISDLRLAECSRILRNLGGTFPEPRPVIALVGRDWSTIYIEPDSLAENFLREWFEHRGVVEPEHLVQFLMAGCR